MIFMRAAPCLLIKMSLHKHLIYVLIRVPFGRIEKISYDAYNESTVLKEAAERLRKRTGHYPERILADQIYRTRENRKYCKIHGIRLSGPKLGRPSLEKQSAKEKKQEYQDNTDRIEVERAFSLSKRCYGMGLIRTKETVSSFV